MSRVEKTIASVVIHGAAWLRGRAKLLEQHGDMFSPRFTARYLTGAKA